MFANLSARGCEVQTLRESVRAARVPRSGASDFRALAKAPGVPDRGEGVHGQEDRRVERGERSIGVKFGFPRPDGVAL